MVNMAGRRERGSERRVLQCLPHSGRVQGQTPTSETANPPPQTTSTCCPIHRQARHHIDESRYTIITKQSPSKRGKGFIHSFKYYSHVVGVLSFVSKRKRQQDKHIDDDVAAADRSWLVLLAPRFESAIHITAPIRCQTQAWRGGERRGCVERCCGDEKVFMREQRRRHFFKDLVNVFFS